MGAEGAGFATRQTAVEINGIHTDIIVQCFTDRIFVTVTQLQKMGTLVRPPPPCSLSPHHPSSLLALRCTLRTKLRAGLDTMHSCRLTFLLASGVGWGGWHVRCTH